jgi:hypothetical protein
MPLVWQITNELKGWLSPDKLRTFNRRWREQGGGMADEVVEDFISVLTRPEMHYESLLGYLETCYRKPTPYRADYHHLYSWFVEMVSHLLRLRHTDLAHFIARNIRFLSGITVLAETNAPLWIFSLNHDVIIECLAAHHSIPLHSGFASGGITLPRRNSSGAITGTLCAETLTAAQLDAGIPFPSIGTKGINLLKIHGALDIFTFRDGADLARILPPEPMVAGTLEMLRIANEELIWVEPNSGQIAHATNEIAYADETGEMQFLRRSLLSGAYKFDNRESQVLPANVLKQFSSNINHLTTLIVIGYGFGDLHINQILRAWLEFSADRHLEIVGPGMSSIPSFLLHVSPQVSVVSEKTCAYFDRIAGIQRTPQELLEKRLADWVLANRTNREALAAYEAFYKDFVESCAQVTSDAIAGTLAVNEKADSSAAVSTLQRLQSSILEDQHVEYYQRLAAFLAHVEVRAR